MFFNEPIVNLLGLFANAAANVICSMRVCANRNFIHVFKCDSNDQQLVNNKSCMFVCMYVGRPCAWIPGARLISTDTKEKKENNENNRQTNCLTDRQGYKGLMLYILARMLLLLVIVML